MNSAKRYLVIALSFAICMTVFAAFAPRIAHAVTATLVQVVNTYTNPAAVARADDPGRTAVRLTYFEFMPAGTLQSVNNPLNDFNTGLPYTVPAGKRLVVDGISAFAEPPSGEGVVVSLSYGGPVGNSFTSVPLVKQGSYSGFDFYVSGGVSPSDYVDSGSGYLVTTFRTSDAGDMIWRLQVNGHLVDCTNGGGC